MRGMLVLMLAACGADATVAGPLDLGVARAAVRAEMSLLTYNVAGLPGIFSSSEPKEYTPQISPKLNAYDVVLVQEDFSYHDELISAAEHPYQSEHDSGSWIGIGDGLNQLARFPFSALTRREWNACSGRVGCYNDCLAPKGFSFSEMTLPQGRVHVYNMHLDAGDCEKDIATRGKQIGQLIDFVEVTSRDQAVIIAGDTNLENFIPEDLAALDHLLQRLGARDACRELSCGVEEIDRVLIRNGLDVGLEVKAWGHPAEFVTADGLPLSDHPPLAVRIALNSSL